MKRILVSLISYKNDEVTYRCLASLKQVKTQKVELVVSIVNNNPTDTFTYTEKAPFSYNIYQSKDNVGFTGGHNYNFKRVEAEDFDYILVLNNDTILAPDFLLELVETAVSYDNQGVFSPLVYFAKDHEYHKDRYSEAEKGKVIWYAGGIIDWENLLLSHRGIDEVDNGQYTQVETTDFISGCCMLIPRRVLKRTGLFDERYFLYLEDADFTQRVKQQGYSLYFVPSARIWHENAGSTGGSGSTLQDYFITRNRLLFGMNYAPARTKLALMKQSIILLNTGRTWQKRGVRDYFLRKFGKGSIAL